jgi:hypothetical protein
MFFTLISFALAIVIAMAGYSASRTFVANRLRFVDAVNSRLAPLGAGLAAALVAMPIFGLLPLVGTGTALTLGISVWAGAALDPASRDSSPA